MGNNLDVPTPDFLNPISDKIVAKGVIDRSPLNAVWEDVKGAVSWIGDRITGGQNIISDTIKGSQGIVSDTIKGGQGILNNLTNPWTLGIVVVGAIVVLKVISK